MSTSYKPSLHLSPLTGAVHIGRESKTEPGVLVGEKTDVTGTFTVIMLVVEAQNRIDTVELENKKLRTENQTLKDTLEAWQAVIRVAREKDSTLPDPESSI